MFDIGFWEILVIGVIALLVLGPERLPGAIRSAVNTIRSVKSMATGFKQEVEEHLKVHELHENLKKAEAMGIENVSPEVAKSVEELKQAAASVQRPYRKKDSESTSNTDESSGSDETSQKRTADLTQTSEPDSNNHHKSVDKHDSQTPSSKSQ